VTTVDGQANVLGALALVIADQTSAAIAAAAGHTGTAAAALSALDQFLDQPTIDRLRQVLGLTPSGAVRLVDRLAEAGLVSRGPGTDGRSLALTLTPAGRRTARRIGRARTKLLRGYLDDLSPAERETLHGLLGRVMAAVVARKDGGAWTCRLCDLTACGRRAGECPAANAAAARYASDR